MNKADPNNIDYELLERVYDDYFALYTVSRVDESKLPEGVYVYDIRGDGNGEFYEIEPHDKVVVNFEGSLLCVDELLEPTDECYRFRDEDYSFAGDTLTLQEFLKMDKEVVDD